MKNFIFSLSSDEEALRIHIRVKLKEIMLQVNLDEVTPKFVIVLCLFFLISINICRYLVT
jgi:hypothetical protein